MKYRIALALLFILLLSTSLVGVTLPQFSGHKKCPLD
jgi:hypothetical protein